MMKKKMINDIKTEGEMMGFLLDQGISINSGTPDFKADPLKVIEKVAEFGYKRETDFVTNQTIFIRKKKELVIIRKFDEQIVLAMDYGYNKSELNEVINRVKYKGYGDSSFWTIDDITKVLKDELGAEELETKIIDL